MLSSICPLGERARHNSWAVTATWYTAASAAAAAAVGAALGALGAAVLAPLVPAAARIAVLAALAAAAAIADATGRRPPGPRRQVDEDWLGRYRGWVYGAGFGAQLGAGVTTIVTTAAVWLVLAAEALSASPATGVLLGLAFGVARAFPLLASRRVRTHALLVERQRALAARAGAARRGTVAALATGAAALAAVAAR